jgi:DNA-binding NarL/FixJ family response regulator
VSKIRVLVADDHGVVRKGLRLQLERYQDFEVVGEAADGREAVALALQLRPDVVLMDIRMPRLSGTEAVREIAAGDRRIRVLILSMHDERSFVADALRAGAAGYVLKGAPSSELLQAIEAVGNGRAYLSPALSGEAIAVLRGDGPALPDALAGLTRRERQVLQSIAEGLCSKEIASALHVSERTVESHRAHLMRKLGVHKASALVRIAIREGLVQA